MTADIETRTAFKIRTLVVFYSRTGQTRTLAKAIAERLDADLEQLMITGEESGTRGYLRCALDGLLGRHVDLALPLHNPNVYDVVVIASPVWSGSLSSPVRTYLTAQDGRLRRVALAVSNRGGSVQHVVTQLRRLTGLPPIATMAVSNSELETPVLRHRLDRFVRAIISHVHGPAPVRRDARNTPTMRA